MTSSVIFKRRGISWDKNILESKIRSLGPQLVRKQDGDKDGGLGPKINVFKICVKYYCGGAVKKLMQLKRITDGGLETGPPVLEEGPQSPQAMGDFL